MAVRRVNGPRRAGGTTDRRVVEYRRVARKIAGGHFRVVLSPGPRDALGKLGDALVRLGMAMERRVSEQRALLEVAGRINSGLVLEEVLNHVYEGFKPFIPYDRLACALIDAPDASVRAVWARSGEGRLHIDRGYTQRLEKRSSLARILESGEPRILNDLEEYLRDNPTSDSTRRIVAEGIRSSLTCPLVANGKPVGFLFFSSKRAGTYARAHTAVYRALASHVSLIVEKAKLYDEILETRRQLVEANQALERVAYHDALTGIPNRRYFDSLLDREWKRAQRLSAPLSLVIADVDHFKQYNDTQGHPAGDECLRRVAGALAETARRGVDLVARLGGEEFAVLLPQTALADAVALAEGMRARVEGLAIPHRASLTGPSVTVSLGVAGCVPAQGSSAAELITVADKALYEAKRSGRNRVASSQ